MFAYAPMPRGVAVLVALAFLMMTPEVYAWHFVEGEKNWCGAEVSLRLKKGDGQNDVIEAIINNISSVSEYYKGPDGFNANVRIYYQEDGKDIPLRNYSWTGGSATEAPEIKPGRSLSRLVTLSPEEEQRIAGRSVKCSVVILVEEGEIVKRYQVDSTPVVLLDKTK